MNLPTLEHVLEYKNHPILKLYKQNYPNHTLSAEIAFREVLKYLWLTQKHADDLKKATEFHELPEQCVMLMSMREVDDMWHEFILFTEDYTDFCLKYFGKYLHHLPNIFDNAPMPREEEKLLVQKLLPYIYDNLGEETMRIWFANYLLPTPK